MTTLAATGLDVGVVSAPLATAIDEAAVARIADGTALLFTVEEHLRMGGIGGTFAEIIAGQPNHPVLLRGGIAHPPPKVALDQNAMRAHNAIDRDSLVRRVQEALRRD